MRLEKEGNMKVILLICFIILCQNTFGQTSSSKELYAYVDSLITNVLKYKPDSILTKDTIVAKKPRAGIVCCVSFPKNPAPLIIIDGNVMEKEKLKGIKLKSIRIIEGFLKDNQLAMALYGQSGTNGVIFLTTKKFAKKSKKNKMSLLTTMFLTQ